MYEILDTNNDKITEQLLERIIAEVHERALDQPNYSQMYAQLCADICTRIHANKQMAEDEVEVIVILLMCAVQHSSLHRWGGLLCSTGGAPVPCNLCRSCVVGCAMGGLVSG